MLPKYKYRFCLKFFQRTGFSNSYRNARELSVKTFPLFYFLFFRVSRNVQETKLTSWINILFS